MRRVIFAGVLALPTLLLVGPSAQAQCSGGNCPAIGGAVLNPFMNCSYLGCGGFCFRLFPGLHQEGPLFNYGPYYGYYPFEPYGPWNANLQYTGPTGPSCPGGNCGGCAGGHCGGTGWGTYAKATLHNIGHRVHPFHKHKASGCTTCAGGTGEVVSEGTTTVTEAAPATETAEPATVSPSSGSENAGPVIQAGYPRRER